MPKERAPAGDDAVMVVPSFTTPVSRGALTTKPTVPRRLAVRIGHGDALAILRRTESRVFAALVLPASLVIHAAGTVDGAAPVQRLAVRGVLAVVIGSRDALAVAGTAETFFLAPVRLLAVGVLYGDALAVLHAALAVEVADRLTLFELGPFATPGVGLGLRAAGPLDALELLRARRLGAVLPELGFTTQGGQRRHCDHDESTEFPHGRILPKKV